MSTQESEIIPGYSKEYIDREFAKYKEYREGKAKSSGFVMPSDEQLKKDFIEFMTPASSSGTGYYR